ncbi:MAG: cupin domain-containing protein [Terracidiphilus sp.]
MDVLSDILSSMRLRGALYSRFEVTAPWAIRFDTGPERARFGLVTRGSCWLTAGCATEAVPLRGGDCFLMFDPSAFVIGDDPQTPTRTCGELAESADVRHGSVIQFGGDGPPAGIITGWFTFDPVSSRPLISLLPPCLHFRFDEERSTALRATLDLLSIETNSEGFGRDLVVRSLADILFVQALRVLISGSTCPRQGFLAALADPQLSRAIHVMHTELARSWTVASLAAVCGMSRPAFAMRFKQVVGQAPLEYLTQWRMSQAMRMLREETKPLSAIALAVGYDADSAFAKAFRRHTGMAPGAYRRGEARENANV